MYRIGFAYDVHKIVDDRALILGGVKIPYHKGLLGHSDADVLVHTVIEAMLGALAMGSLGDLFPDTDSKYKNISSLLLLKKTMLKIKNTGYKINNLDVTIVAQEPKLSPFIFEMRTKLAIELATDIKNISIKATTTEKLGFPGRKEGIASYCIVMLKKDV